MGLIELIRGKRIFIDTAPIIYFIEKNAAYVEVVESVFNAADDEDVY